MWSGRRHPEFPGSHSGPTTERCRLCAWQHQSFPKTKGYNCHFIFWPKMCALLPARPVSCVWPAVSDSLWPGAPR